MLLFLHGFLGQKEDWAPLFSHLKNHQKIAINLPGHASEPFSEDVALSVKKRVPNARFLIGYSAGGRVALELKNRYPSDYEKVILISTNPGRLNDAEKKKRFEIDQEWIEKLKNQSLDLFLDEWYDQPLFSTLKKHSSFLSILERRKKQNSGQLARFLETYSLSKKTSEEILTDAFWICGKEDLKYQKLYRKLIQLYKIYTIENASHAVHLENPKALAQVLEEIISEYNEFNTVQDILRMARGK